MASQIRGITRRRAAKGVALAAAGAGFLAFTDLAKAGQKTEKGCCSDASLPDKSVFTIVCNDKSADKYRHGDNPVVYRLGALWLMLATENWTDYFRDPKDAKSEKSFLDGLAKELKLNPADVQTLWAISKTKETSFKDIRAAWKNFTSNTSVYGARPCLGGQSTLKIACLDQS